MSLVRYIELLQAILTMTNPEDEEQVLYAKNILKNLLELTRSSRMFDRRTFVAMERGYYQFSMLLRRKSDFAGNKGAVTENQIKRQRLQMMLVPTC